jgi:hypothetical protein
VIVTAGELWLGGVARSLAATAAAVSSGQAAVPARHCDVVWGRVIVKKAVVVVAATAAAGRDASGGAAVGLVTAASEGLSLAVGEGAITQLLVLKLSKVIV